MTGAASGIGAVTAEVIASRGNRVIGVDLHESDVVADLSTPEGRSDAARKTLEKAQGTGIDAVIGAVACWLPGP